MFDPFGGVGTTGLEAIKMGYEAFLMDVNPLGIFASKVKTSHYNEQEISLIKKELLKDVTEASVAVRNFPLSANELRKSLNLKESDENFVFGTTLIGEKKVVILAKKI